MLVELSLVGGCCGGRRTPLCLLGALVGLLLFFVVLHIARGIGALHARIAEVLLVRL